MCVKLVNRILLGLLMLVPGLMKLFVITPTNVTGMLGGFGFPLPGFFAWILILSEIVFGIAILANWKLQYTAWPPAFILSVATLVTIPWSNLADTQLPSVLLHLVAITNYWWLGVMTNRSDGMKGPMESSRGRK